MQCPKCNYDNREEARFCRRCGAVLELICPQCQHRNEPDALFCDECGTKLDVGARHAVSLQAVDEAVPKLEDMQKQLQDRIPQSLADRLFAGAKQMQGEYRLVTALFADVAGSSGMARDMPLEQYVQTMNDCFKMMVDTISIKYEGSINRFIGDCVLAFFGAPITHENDAERAILAALDIRGGVKELGLDVSVGINTGTTYVGEMGSDLYLERSAWGPDVDFAKRLQESASPGHIWVGASTYRLVSRAFDFATPVDFEAKGMEGTAHPVLSVKEHPEKLRGIEGLRARMIGREHEFSELIHSAEEWLDGRGQMVSIIGEAGIGKSRLVRELREYLDSRDDDIGYLWLEGRCVSIGQPISYWPFLDILHSWFALSEDDTESQRVGKVREHIEELLPDRCDDILPFLGHLMNLKFGGEIDTMLEHYSPEQVSYHTMMRLRDIFVAMAQKQRLLLILEDLHWADDLSLDLLSLLMDELMAHPLMLLCVYRPEQKHRVWRLGSQAQRKCLERYTELTLQKLPPASSRRLVHELLDIDDLPDSVREMILQKSEGNPFFIEEVIRSLMERELVYREDGRWKAKEDITQIDVPDTIQSVVLARVDRLAAEAKYVLQCASVIGRLFKHRLLEHLTHKQKELDEYITEFEERDLVYEERTVPELEYAFKHALTQEATYQGILEQRRRVFHRGVAQGIEKLYHERIEDFYEELAYHWERSGDNDKTLEYLLKAGGKAAGKYLNDAAIDYYTQALELAKEINTSSDQLGEIHEKRGNVYFYISFYEEAVSDMIEAANHYPQGNKRAGMYQQISAIYNFYISDKFEASRYAQKALEEFEPADKSRETCQLYYSIALTLIYHIDLEKGESFLREAIAISEEMDYKDLLAYQYVQLLWMYSPITYPNSVAYNEERQTAWAKANHYLPYAKPNLTDYSLTCASLAWSAMVHGNLAENEDYIIYLAQEALDSGVKSGYVYSAVVAIESLNDLYRNRGDFRQAIGAYEKVWHRVIEARFIYPGFMPILQEHLMDLYAFEGDWSRLFDLTLQVVDSTLVLYRKSEVHPTVQHRWNRVVDRTYAKLHAVSPDVFENLKDELRIRLRESSENGKRFFYHGQLMSLALLEGCHADAAAHAGEMMKLYSNAGSFPKRISTKMGLSMELLSASEDQGPEVVTKLLKQIDDSAFFWEAIEAMEWLLKEDKIGKMIDWDQLDQVILKLLQRIREQDIADSLRSIYPLYESFGRAKALNGIVKRAWNTIPDSLKANGVTQLLLDPVELWITGMPDFTMQFDHDPVSSGWEWVNPAEDCIYQISGTGIELLVPARHNIWGSNYKGPRFLREIRGDFIAETYIQDGSTGKKFGGLLAWGNERNFARFEVASSSVWYKGCVYYGASVSGKFIHPGIHPFEVEEAWLRLERKGDRFTGYVSADGENWYRCGWADIPIEDPIQVGIHALCPEFPATSTRFEHFKIFRAE